MAKKKTDSGSPIKSVDGLSRGYKSCPQCGKGVPARTHQCDCSHIFIPKKTKVVASQPSPLLFRATLEQEKKRLETLLGNREKLEQQLKGINELLTHL